MESKEIEEDNPINGLRRVRVKRRSERKKKGNSFIISFGLDLLLLLTLILGIVLLFRWPPIYEQINNHLFANVIKFVISGQTKNFVSGSLLAIGLIGGLLRLNWRIKYNPNYWRNHCPNCGSSGENLHRARRKPLDRLIGRLGIPVRRYICQNCHWNGLRIDETRLS